MSDFPVDEQARRSANSAGQNRSNDLDLPVESQLEATHAMPPSKVVPIANGNEVETLPQQASTQPGDGSQVNVSNVLPLKYRVVGVSGGLRFTANLMLFQPELKEHGQTILDGGFPSHTSVQERPSK
ncbi:hypothetical protein FA15DRAFT_591550 [Coprinopsis marcescibilis]|uniref:Uncharacterized protein n=1 Tax=Coprinopsis marcescibilis TaxID=230819 RepID=A0A5C3KYS8_COPMA|nr:hypothetical protein FA15DRAFT_591550 [Coprinopsis marcescibilis]